jgi:hypothetical protein
MIAQEQNYRIVPDPANPKLWAYQVMQGVTVIKTVQGFKSSKDAKRAYDRSRNK